MALCPHHSISQRLLRKLADADNRPIPYIFTFFFQIGLVNLGRNQVGHTAVAGELFINFNITLEVGC